ncbi:hypothetical protein NDU88_000989 [Pleurodeles waltl]|uniref:Uncharacterized protein n=1 Tax=Pleurodeles waltl TaxID=8319 RepID=A0AAV7TGJ4_PLEWA|nr:hypothetical protein NDU88_000989 [Pleurodeles waltl]
MQHSPGAPFGRHSRAGAWLRLRPLGVFPPGRSSAVPTGHEERGLNSFQGSLFTPSPLRSSTAAPGGAAGPASAQPREPAPAGFLFSGTRRAAAWERGPLSLIAHRHRLPRVQGSQGLLGRRILLGQTMLAMGG